MLLSNQPRAHLQQVMRRLGCRRAIGRYLTALRDVGSERGRICRTLGLTNDLFITGKTWATGEYLAIPARRSVSWNNQ